MSRALCHAPIFKASISCSTSSRTRPSTRFLEVAKVDSQTVELHFALGNLFRRRGETERAIRMHQNLIDRARSR
jgi:lipopolysaccharide biosynthesis regulator YciM